MSVMCHLRKPRLLPKFKKNLISSFLYHPAPFHKISVESRAYLQEGGNALVGE